MQNLPSILSPDLGLLFWMSLAFIVVLVVVGKFGFPVIVKMVQERKNFIDESLKMHGKPMKSWPISSQKAKLF